jgi:hypothetical protein
MIGQLSRSPPPAGVRQSCGPRSIWSLRRNDMRRAGGEGCLELPGDRGASDGALSATQAEAIEVQRIGVGFVIGCEDVAQDRRVSPLIALDIRQQLVTRILRAVL